MTSLGLFGGIKSSAAAAKHEKSCRVSLTQQLEFERKGHSRIRGLFSEAEINELKQLVVLEAKPDRILGAYKHRVSVLCPGFDTSTLQTIEQAKKIINTKGSDELGFLQLYNLHRTNPTLLKKFIHHPILCQTAAELLGTKKVRLYQDCLFIKQPGFGVTNWHSDLNMVPIDTNSFLTFWIPLHALSSTDSRLHFASASHRDFALPYWQSNKGMSNLERRGYTIEAYKQLQTGDLTVHHGWTLHWASEQPLESTPRLAWTVSYFADGAKLLCTKHARRKVHEEDSSSFGDWYKDLREGDLARHKLLPLVHT